MTHDATGLSHNTVSICVVIANGVYIHKVVHDMINVIALLYTLLITSACN